MDILNNNTDVINGNNNYLNLFGGGKQENNKNPILDTVITGQDFNVFKTVPVSNNESKFEAKNDDNDSKNDDNNKNKNNNSEKKENSSEDNETKQLPIQQVFFGASTQENKNATIGWIIVIVVIIVLIIICIIYLICKKVNNNKKNKTALSNLNHSHEYIDSDYKVTKLPS